MFLNVLTMKSVPHLSDMIGVWRAYSKNAERSQARFAVFRISGFETGQKKRLAFEI